MDGKLLILCDELPGDYEGYSVKDRNFLVSFIRYPEDDTDRLFVCWDSIIPEDRSFIETCKYYARCSQMPKPTFSLSQKGATDVRNGTIKGSVEEHSYLYTYDALLDYLKGVKRSGGDLYGEIMERAVQFPLDARERFFRDFSSLLQANGVVRILPAYSNTTHVQTTNYRESMLEAWKSANKFMPANKKSSAKVLPSMRYSNIGEVYSRSIEEMMQIYSMPIFGEQDEKEQEF